MFRTLGLTSPFLFLFVFIYIESYTALGQLGLVLFYVNFVYNVRVATDSRTLCFLWGLTRSAASPRQGPSFPSSIWSSIPFYFLPHWSRTSVYHTYNVFLQLAKNGLFICIIRIIPRYRRRTVLF